MQAFPYFYVPYDNEFPTDPVQGMISSLPISLVTAPYMASTLPSIIHRDSMSECAVMYSRLLHIPLHISWQLGLQAMSRADASPC